MYKTDRNFWWMFHHAKSKAENSAWFPLIHNSLLLFRGKTNTHTLMKRHMRKWVFHMASHFPMHKIFSRPDAMDASETARACLGRIRCSLYLHWKRALHFSLENCQIPCKSLTRQPLLRSSASWRLQHHFLARSFCSTAECAGRGIFDTWQLISMSVEIYFSLKFSRHSHVFVSIAFILCVAINIFIQK